LNGCVLLKIQISNKFKLGSKHWC